MNPEYVFHPSFQLSFIAVLSLISGYEFYIKNQWILGECNGIIAKIRFYVASNIYSSFLVSIVTAPIVINQFYVFSTYAIPMNLIAVPIMSFFLMPLAILFVFLMPLGLDSVIAKCLEFFIKIIISAAQIAIDAPSSVWYFGYISNSSLLIFLFGFMWIVIWRTNWRLFGIPIILLSFYLMLNTPKPDIIINAKLGAIGVKNTQNKLEIYAHKISSFNKQYWANWFGQRDAAISSRTVNYITTSSGKTISINFKDTKCKNADVQIYMQERVLCNYGTLTLDYDFLTKIGVIAIFCDHDKCKTKYSNSIDYH